MPFSATADGNVSAGTCSLTEDCHAGPNSAIPLPTMKQDASRICGVTRPSHASTDSAVAPTSAIDSETSAADEVICVIAQAAPTPWINRPRLDNRLASQMRRNTVCRSGAATP